MSLRRVIVEVDPGELNVAEFCRTHGVSTWFFWDLRRRYRREGEVVLEPKSRAPRRVANRTPVEMEDLIVTARKELNDAGLDSGPASIAFRLRAHDGVPSESTIWRILTARGLITPNPNKAPRQSRRSYTAERANECWALDDWRWTMADGTEVAILDVIDDHSRLAVACVPMRSCTGANAFQALADAAPLVGWPQRFWSDNATAFTATLANALAELGIAASHTRPYSPHSNGKIERFHQTVAKWLHQQPPAATIDDLATQLDEFRHIYNTQRPHRALNRQFPATVWEHAPKTGPHTHRLDQPTTVHHSTVHHGICHAGRYRITIGATHNHTTATTIITGTTAHVFTNGHLARHLTIDPTRHHQPLHNRPGRPTTTESQDPRHA